MHKWYDGLKEPKRFLVFFIPAVILIGGIYVPYPAINSISFGILVIALIYRVFYIHSGKKGGQ